MWRGSGIMHNRRKEFMTIKGLFGPLVLAVVLATGFMLLWGFAGVWILEAAASGNIPIGTEHLTFLLDGTALVGRIDESREVHYRDLEGNPTAAPEYQTARLSTAP